MDILIPILTMGILGLLFSSGLVLAYKKLRVEEDPRVMEIFEILPQANCGACGFSGCRAFAEAVVKGAAPVNGCPVGGEEVASKIASILGVEAKTMVKKVARIHCRGTKEAAKERGVYLGIATCAAAHLIGGQKQCSYGCLGFGDCVRACLFEAMWMGEDGLPHVDETKCTGCGQCVEDCPLEIITMENDFPVVDENICIGCGVCLLNCPTGAAKLKKKGPSDKQDFQIVQAKHDVTSG